MLKTDYEGIREFEEKIEEAQGEEVKELCMERQQMWLNKITDFIFPVPRADLPFVINVMKMLGKTLEETEPEAKEAAKEIINGSRWETQRKTISKDMTEAAARAYAEAVFRK